MNIEQIKRDGLERSRSDGKRWSVYGIVEKFHGDRSMDADYRARHGIGSPEEYAECFGNLLVNNGLTRITSLIIAGGGQGWTNTATRLGVGDSSAAATVGQTDLQASTNKYWMTMDATYPSVSVGVITVKATFGTGVGNFAWNEWAVDVGTPTVAAGASVNTMMNRKVASLGTKTAAASWVFTVTITIA